MSVSGALWTACTTTTSTTLSTSPLRPAASLSSPRAARPAGHCMTGALASISDIGLGALPPGWSPRHALIGLWSRRWWPMSRLLRVERRDTPAPAGGRRGHPGPGPGGRPAAASARSAWSPPRALGGTPWSGSHSPGPHSYPAVFWIGAVSSAVPSSSGGSCRLRHQEARRASSTAPLRLFYALQLLFGARKQVFITFAPWVLVAFSTSRPTCSPASGDRRGTGHSSSPSWASDRPRGRAALLLWSPR